MHSNAVDEREKKWADERKERQKEEDERINVEEKKLLEKLKNKYD